MIHRDAACCVSTEYTKNRWIFSTGFLLVKFVYVLRPKQSHYATLEVDVWTYVKRKSNKVWLIDAYDRESCEILAYVWGGKRNLKTAKKLRKKLSELGVTYTKLCPDNRQSFITAFKADHHEAGKDKTVGIEGNNHRIRHRIKRAVRKTCRFSKKMVYHLKAFDVAFFYVNWGYV